jgi:hypothetical protein
LALASYWIQERVLVHERMCARADDLEADCVLSALGEGVLVDHRRAGERRGVEVHRRFLPVDRRVRRRLLELADLYAGEGGASVVALTQETIAEGRPSSFAGVPESIRIRSKAERVRDRGVRRSK